MLISVLRGLGSYISFPKIKPPSTINIFLGIEINSIKLQLWPPVKFCFKLKQMLVTFKTKCKATRKELEKLGGYLSHCSTVIKGGRSFSSRIFNATHR